MRIVTAITCTILFSLTLPSLSFAGSDCDDADSKSDVKKCVKSNNGNGNGNNAKNKDYDDDYYVSCMRINNLTLRRECLDKRRD